MENDTGRSIAALPQGRDGLVSDILKFAKLRTDRPFATKWAGDLKLVTFNDAESTHTLSHSDVADTPPWHIDCTACETHFTRVSDHRCEHHVTEYELRGKGRQKIQHRVKSWSCQGNECGTVMGLGERFQCADCLKDYCRQCASNCPCGKDDRLYHFPGVCEHIASHYCVGCTGNPDVQPFPPKGEIRSLQIVKQSQLSSPNEYPLCDDFLAVSYMWSPDSQRGSYQICENKGTKNEIFRANRAPDQVLDRVIAFARENGFRFFWIDQDDTQEKSVAVEGMDLVYAKAALTLGLLNTPIDSQQHLISLSNLYLWNTGWNDHITCAPRQSNLALPGIFDQIQLSLWHFAESILDFFDNMSRERWFDRAWILQESFSAPSKTCLLFPKGCDIKLDNCYIVCEQSSLSECAVDMLLLSRCVEYAVTLFNPTGRPDLADSVPELRRLRMDRKTIISHVLNWMETRFPRTTSFPESVPCITGPYNIPNYNAARAFSHLQYREGKFVADRLAILANLCRYEIRLRLLKQPAPESLTAGILALTILNNDFSLLVPEAYFSDPKNIDAPRQASATGEPSRHTWLPPRLRLADAHYREASTPVITIPPMLWRCGITERGLHFPGWLWKLNGVTDLTDVQSAWAHDWYMLNAWHAYLNLGPKDTVHGWASQWSSAIQKLPCDVRKKLSSLEDGILKIAQDSTTMDPEQGPQGMTLKKVRRYLDQCYYDILLAIILSLRNRQELGLADAVWNSTQGSCWNIPGSLRNQNDVPQTVADFPENMTHEDIRKYGGPDLFQLDNNSPSGYTQDWLIERVMTQGRLRYGRLVHSSDQSTMLSLQQEFENSKGKECSERDDSDSVEDQHSVCGIDRPSIDASDIHENNVWYMKVPKDKRVNTQSNRSRRGTTGTATRDKQKDGSKSHKRRDLALEPEKRGRYHRDGSASMGVSVQGAVLNSRERHAGKSRDFDDPMQDPGALMQFLMALFRDTHEDEGHHWGSGMETRRAFFDVDISEEDICILTPFQGVLEMMPRPALRGMSISWKVRNADAVMSKLMDPKEGRRGQSSRVTEEFQALAQVKGMWAADNIMPGKFYRIV